jgi:hypothetical protein
MVNGRIYVGLTQRTAFVRFTEHLYSAGALARQQRAGVKPDLKLDTPLYRDMVRVGWRNFGVVILQKVAGGFRPGNKRNGYMGARF